MTAVKNTWGLRTKKLVVAVDQERARTAGVTSDDVAYSLQASLTGIDMTQYREDDKLIPVTLRSVAADRQDIGKLDGLSVYSQASGATVPLKQVADVRLTFEPGVIERRDRVTDRCELADTGRARLDLVRQECRYISIPASTRPARCLNVGPRHHRRHSSTRYAIRRYGATFASCWPEDGRRSSRRAAQVKSTTSNTLLGRLPG